MRFIDQIKLENDECLRLLSLEASAIQEKSMSDQNSRQATAIVTVGSNVEVQLIPSGECLARFPLPATEPVWEKARAYSEARRERLRQEETAAEWSRAERGEAQADAALLRLNEAAVDEAMRTMGPLSGCPQMEMASPVVPTPQPLPPLKRLLEPRQALDLAEVEEYVRTMRGGVGVKHDTKKSRPDLFSPSLLLGVGHVLRHGGEKYGFDNWRLVGKVRYVAATWRHWLAYCSGEKLDPDSGYSHLAHLVANLSFLWEKDQDATGTERGGSARAGSEAAEQPARPDRV